VHELQKDEAPIDRAIAAALVSCIPPEEHSIVLTLTRPSGSHEIGDLVHELGTPEGTPPLLPESELYEATYRLDQLFQQHGAVFTRAVYTVHIEDGRARFRAEFEYLGDK
jgi:hypothetical protein